MPRPILVSFVAGAFGPWTIDTVASVAGEGLPAAERLAVVEGASAQAAEFSPWTLKGYTSNTRYTSRTEVDALTRTQEDLRRDEATCAALIPIRKTEAWWSLAQDERRAIFEEQSRHIGIGLSYLPAVARRLHHSRDMGEAFDFLTWFEFAPEHADAFEEMVRKLRNTPEWRFVDREVDIRLSRPNQLGGSSL